MVRVAELESANDKRVEELVHKIKELETNLPQDKAMVVTNSMFDVDKEMVMESDYIKWDKREDAKTGKVKMTAKLAAADFSAYSIEDFLSQGLYGNTAKYWEYYKAVSVLRKCINLIAGFTARAGFETTIKCINADDDPNKPEYLEVKRKIDEVNRQVNLDNVIFITQVKRYLYGMCAWEIVQGARTKAIMELQPLRNCYVYPKLNADGQFTGVEYSPAKTGFFPKEKILFFNLDALENGETDLQGVSSIKSIEREIKIKKNLQRDLLYAARSLWAPIVIYQADTRGLTPTERDALFNNLKTDLKPGGVVITNRSVQSTVVQYNPDLNNLIRAVQMQDEEIIGNYGIPKALLSREKTIARATLEFSIKAFYESTISQEQIYLKRQLEKQWYDPLVKSLGYGDKIRIRHEWKPIMDPASDLIVALTRAYDSGVLSGEEFFRRLGWELDRVPEEASEEEPEKPATPPRKKGKVNVTEIKKGVK